MIVFGCTLQVNCIEDSPSQSQQHSLTTFLEFESIFHKHGASLVEEGCSSQRVEKGCLLKREMRKLAPLLAWQQQVPILGFRAQRTKEFHGDGPKVGCGSLE